MTQSSASVSKGLPRWIAPLLIALICLVLEWPALKGPFVFDDFPNLSSLEKVQRYDVENLRIYLSQAHDFPGRPLAMLSFLPQKASWPNSPFPFKLVNLLIHLLCGGLVFAFTRQLLLAYRSRNQNAPLTAETYLVPCLTMAAWLWHPMQLSTTMLVIQRMTELFAVFLLLGLMLYVHAVISTQRSTVHRAIAMATGLGMCMVLATLSKESGILLPVYALAMDATLLRSQVASLEPTLRWLRRVLIYVPVAFILVYLGMQLPAYANIGSYRNFTLSERLLTESHIIFDYLGQIFFPRYGSYSIFHDGYPVSRSWLAPASTLFTAAGVACLIIAGFWLRKRSSVIAFAILWFLGGHLLESTVVPLELYFEHRNYIPMIGPLFALAYLAGIWIRAGSNKRLLAGTLAFAWLCACLIATSLTAITWGNADTLAATWKKADPDSIRATHMLAERYYDRGQYDKALATIDDLASRQPDSANLALSKAFLLCTNQSFDDQAYQRLLAILKVAPFERGGFEYVSNMKGLALADRCTPTLTAETWKAIPAALLTNPAYNSYRYAVGYLHYQLHEMAVKQGQLDEAIRQLDLTEQSDPDPELPRLKAQYLASAGLYDAAIQVLQNADYQRLPLLRRLLVDDKSINLDLINQLKEKEISAEKEGPPHPASSNATPAH